MPKGFDDQDNEIDLDQPLPRHKKRRRRPPEDRGLPADQDLLQLAREFLSRRIWIVPEEVTVVIDDVPAQAGGVMPLIESAAPSVLPAVLATSKYRARKLPLRGRRSGIASPDSALTLKVPLASMCRSDAGS